MPLPDKLSLKKLALLLARGKKPSGEISSDLEKELLDSLFEAVNPFSFPGHAKLEAKNPDYSKLNKKISLIAWLYGVPNSQWEFMERMERTELDKYNKLVPPNEAKKREPQYFAWYGNSDQVVVNREDFINFATHKPKQFEKIKSRYKQNPFWQFSSGQSRKSKIKQQVIDEAKEIINEKGYSRAEKIARMSRIAKILNPEASLEGLKDLSPKDYKKRFYKALKTVCDWIRKANNELDV